MSENSEIKTFKDFLDKINNLPANPKYSAFNSSGGSVPHQNSSVPIKGNINPLPTKPSNLTLTLKPLRGEPQTIRVPFSQSIGELRAKAAEIFKISEVERCRLIRGGKALFDDKQSVENVFGTGAETQILHVLEKPPTASATAASETLWKSSADHAIWSKIDGLLQSEAGVSAAAERSAIIEKFRKSLM